MKLSVIHGLCCDVNIQNGFDLLEASTILDASF